MQWTANEELKGKQKEIDNLKLELKRIAIARDEALESQRKDITSAFELLLQQREESFTSKESEINDQIIQLGNRLEQISTDNTTLKSQLSSANRRIEELVTEGSNKDDMIRKLQWRLEDERTIKLQSDEALHKNIQQITFELNTLKISSSTEVEELKSAYSKVFILTLIL